MQERIEFSVQTARNIKLRQTYEAQWRLSRRKNGILYLTAPSHVTKLITIATEKGMREDYVSQRARGGYIASVCRPDLTFTIAYAAQFAEASKTDQG